MPERIGSYVDTSSGGDKDILSFYSTTASTTWREPIRNQSPRKMPEIETGFSKNAVARYQLADDDQAQLTTSYKYSISETLSRKLSADISPRSVSADSVFQGGYPTAARQSPIKWGDETYRRWQTVPSRRILQQRQKQDPFEWENDGLGPADFSTSFRASWIPPHLQKPRYSSNSVTPCSPEGSIPRDGATSGWRENNTFREHPWVHPGAPERAVTTYSVETAIPRKSGNAISDIFNKDPLGSPTTSSGYVRQIKKVILGMNSFGPEDRLSTTHLSYLKGRTPKFPSSGPLVDVAQAKSGEPLGETGFCRAYNTNSDVVLPHATPDLTHDLQTFTTTTASHFRPPNSNPNLDSDVTSSGSQSAYARAVVPVNSLAAAADPDLSYLHPSVALAMCKRDPLYFNARTFKITSRPPSQVRWTQQQGPFSPCDVQFAKATAGLPSARLSILRI